MRVVMIDVDGVLVCGRPLDGRHLFTDLEKDLGFSLEVLRQEFFVPRWTSIVTGKRPLKPELAEVLQTIAPHVDADTLIKYWFENDSRVSLDVLDAIDTIRSNGVKVFLATNQEHMRANYLMNDMGLSASVDGIFYSAALGYRKPATEFYERATIEAGVAASQIAFIDDTLENIEAATAFGWNAFHWKPESKGEDITLFMDSATSGGS
ncbi:HAD family hydrolase [Agrobacterium tumefaciens]|uniref:HAD-IA family hydrolase n=1 Tax=Agrobacterium tumefaciens TaxID=358 RepID=UPI0012B7A242|nr:HAD family hydrolase [Agrobacterium tumefaciens]